jgi:hypothetical protein
VAGFNPPKHWWIVIVAVAAVGASAVSIIVRWMPAYQTIDPRKPFDIPLELPL